ncbi:MFS transporter [Candidatus Parcubacteria bacterium]|nr:MFS transporter [Candidatus Parcubacteria bacterium]
MNFQSLKIEKVTGAATISHFLLMFGYKLFSLYFPLFLLARGFSLSQVGYVYLLIYLPIAVFSPIVGFLNHKINPAILAGLGIFGYGFYSLSMIIVQETLVFYFCQIVLGMSAALFFVSMKAILMGHPLENFDRSFGWFYSSPFYADALAPVVGALFIWKFNFTGVFVLSLIFHILNIFFCLIYLRKPAVKLVDDGFKLKQTFLNYQKAFSKIKEKTVLPFILISLSILFLAGFYRAFFILFLKDIGWSQNQVLAFGSLLSVAFLPISLLVIKKLESKKSEKNIIKGGLIFGFFTILLGAFGFYAPALIILLIVMAKSAGAFLTNSSRSGLVSQKLKQYPEEAGAIDTMFSPLGAASGSLIAGLIIGFLGFSNLFILGGVFVLAIALIVWGIHSHKI